MGIPNTKIAWLVEPGHLMDNEYFDTNIIDSQGYNRIDVYVRIGSIAATMEGLRLLHASNTGDEYEIVPGCDFTADLPTASDDYQTLHFGMDRINVMRYIYLVASAGNVAGGGLDGTYLVAFAVLSKPDVAPTSLTAAGITGSVSGSAASASAISL